MADATEIAWTDSTFNPWWGCQSVGAGCDNCYAAALDRRTGGDHFQAGITPRTMSDENWRKPTRWNRSALKSGVRRKVFCASMCDWADKNAPEGQRERLFSLIRDTSMLDWQLLTKRASNIEKYLPEDWGGGYQNVWLGVTVENRRQGLRRMEMLKNIPATIRFLSIEPLLEDLGALDLAGIHQVIVGGESGNNARAMHPDWARSIRDQCLNQGVPFFFKQWGSHGSDGVKRSKEANGRMLDAVLWDQYPEVGYA